VSFLFFNDNSLHQIKTIDEVKILPEVKYLFKKELIDEIRNEYKNRLYPFYQYSIIDKDNNKSTIRINNFEVIDIGRDTCQSYVFKGRTITLYDHAKQAIRTFKSEINSDNFIVEELLYVLNSLNQENAWEAFQEIIELKKTIKLLNNKIKLKQIEIDSLRSQ
jgi:hypothetical protein